MRPLAAVIVAVAVTSSLVHGAGADPLRLEVMLDQLPSLAASLRDRPAATTSSWDDQLMEIYDGGKGDDTIAVALYAVAAAPSSVPARFTLACALAREGRHPLAARVLGELAHADCPACRDALYNVVIPPGPDGPREVCGFDAAARAVAGTVAPSPVRVATDTILASLNSGDATAAAPYLDGGRITTSSVCSVCDTAEVGTGKTSRAQFLAHIRDAEARFEAGPYTYVPPRIMFCDARCCEGPTGSLSHTQTFVTKVCFRGGAAPKLASLDVIDGG